MSTRTTSYLDAVEHLPADAVLVLHGVSWAEYEQLLKELSAWPGMRITYNKGRLEVMSPSAKHERIKSFIHDMATVFRDEMGLVAENLGSTTFKRKRDDQGAEPDVCFYVRNVEQIIGKDEIDPDSDPPPDVVVEIDITDDSTPKFEIYAGFKVSEIWRYDGRRTWMYRLKRASYVEVSSSEFFPGLTASALTDFIERSRKQGQTAALEAFRRWTRTLR